MGKIFIPHNRIVQTFSVYNQPGVVYTARRTYVRITGGECKWTEKGVIGDYEIKPGIYPTQKELKLKEKENDIYSDITW